MEDSDFWEDDLSEMRFDPIRGKWVLIAEDRGERGDYFLKEPDMDPHSGGNCPFCPGNEDQLGKILYAIKDEEKHFGEMTLKVIPNKYPLFTVEKMSESSAMGPYDFHSTVGAHEVIIESIEHSKILKDYSLKEWGDVLNAVKTRGNDLKKDKRIKFLSFFKNYGFLAGATLKHPHSQIVGMPVIPHSIIEELDNAMEFYSEKNRCIFCDVIKFESDSVRSLLNSKFYSAFSPYASRYPFQIDIYPKRHCDDFFSSSDDESRDLSGLLKEVFQIFYSKIGDIPLNIVLNTTPFNIEGPGFEKFKFMNLFYHYHIQIIPRINKYGGIECGLGLNVNPISPEKAVEILKGV